MYVCSYMYIHAYSMFIFLQKPSIYHTVLYLHNIAQHNTIKHNTIQHIYTNHTLGEGEQTSDIIGYTGRLYIHLPETKRLNFKLTFVMIFYSPLLLHNDVIFAVATS